MEDVALLFNELDLLRKVMRAGGRLQIESAVPHGGALNTLLQFQLVAKSGSEIQLTPRGILALVATENVSAGRPVLIRAHQLDFR